jgi:hypothetical protein
MRLSRLVLIIFLLAACGIGIVWQELSLLELRYERAELERRHLALQAEGITLQSRIEALTTPGRLLAKIQELGLRLAPPAPEADAGSGFALVEAAPGRNDGSSPARRPIVQLTALNDGAER